MVEVGRSGDGSLGFGEGSAGAVSMESKANGGCPAVDPVSDDNSGVDGSIGTVGDNTGVDGGIGAVGMRSEVGIFGFPAPRRGSGAERAVMVYVDTTNTIRQWEISIFSDE